MPYTTVADDAGGAQSYPSYRAAKAKLGNREGDELHHIVEQNQGDVASKGHRGHSGFPEEQINTTSNLVWLPKPVHKRVTRHYQTKDRFTDTTPRKSMRGESWDDQYNYGIRQISRAHYEEYGHD